MLAVWVHPQRKIQQHVWLSAPHRSRKYSVFQTTVPRSAAWTWPLMTKPSPASEPFRAADQIEDSHFHCCGASEWRFWSSPTPLCSHQGGRLNFSKIFSRAAQKRRPASSFVPPHQSDETEKQTRRRKLSLRRKNSEGERFVWVQSSGAQISTNHQNKCQQMYQRTSGSFTVTCANGLVSLEETSGHL